MIDRETYCQFVYNEGEKLEPIFGDLWIASLLNEKNINKSKNLHSVLTHSFNIFKCRSVIRIVFRAIVKYLTFVYMKFVFLGKTFADNNKPLVFSYCGSHLKFFTKNIDCNEIVFPQYTDYKRVSKSGVLTIYSFIKPLDFVAVLFSFLWGWTKIFKCYSSFFNTSIYRGDVLESFFGSVCIENLFYIQVFKRIRKQINKDVKIYYVHEGQGWEKLLCKYLKDNYKIGIVCSAINENLINFFMIKEKWVPNALAVLGSKQKEWFSKYHNNVFIYGAGRYKELSNVSKTKKDGNILVLLPFDSDLALDMLEFVTKSNITEPLYVRKHPYTDNKKLENYILSKYRRDMLDLNASLDKAQIVIATGDTSTVFDALAKGCLVVVIDMSDKGYVQLSCMAENELCVTAKNPEELRSFICSIFYRLRLLARNKRSNRRELLNQHFDFSVDEKQMIDRILNA